MTHTCVRESFNTPPPPRSLSCFYSRHMMRTRVWNIMPYTDVTFGCYSCWLLQFTTCYSYLEKRSHDSWDDYPRRLPIVVSFCALVPSGRVTWCWSFSDLTKMDQVEKLIFFLISISYLLALSGPSYLFKIQVYLFCMCNTHNGMTSPHSIQQYAFLQSY